MLRKCFNQRLWKALPVLFDEPDSKMPKEPNPTEATTVVWSFKWTRQQTNDQLVCFFPNWNIFITGPSVAASNQNQYLDFTFIMFMMWGSLSSFLPCKMCPCSCYQGFTGVFNRWQLETANKVKIVWFRSTLHVACHEMTFVVNWHCMNIIWPDLMCKAPLYVYA